MGGKMRCNFRAHNFRCDQVLLVPSSVIGSLVFIILPSSSLRQNVHLWKLLYWSMFEVKEERMGKRIKFPWTCTCRSPVPHQTLYLRWSASSDALVWLGNKQTYVEHLRCNKGRILWDSEGKWWKWQQHARNLMETLKAGCTAPRDWSSIFCFMMCSQTSRK